MHSFTDPRPIIERKRLPDGSELQLKSWTSDVIEPGRVGYQIALVSHEGNLTTQFPFRWERYSEVEVRKMYSSIHDKSGFNRIRKEVESKDRQ